VSRMASFPLPAHQSGCADFRHQLWRTTFDAQCGADGYVAFKRRHLASAAARGVQHHILGTQLSDWRHTASLTWLRQCCQTRLRDHGFEGCVAIF
jgi:hypothetical protein